MPYIAILDYDNLDNGIFLKAFAEALSRHKKPSLILHGDSEYTERILQSGVMRDEATRRAMKDLNLRLIALLADAGVPAISMHGYYKDAILQGDNGELEISHQPLEHPPGTAMILSALAGKKTVVAGKKIVVAGKKIVVAGKKTVVADQKAVSDLPEENQRAAADVSVRLRNESMAMVPAPVPLPTLAKALSEELKIPTIILFSHAKRSDFMKVELPETLSLSDDRPLLEEHISTSFIDKNIFFGGNIDIRLATPDRFGRESELDTLPRIVR